MNVEPTHENITRIQNGYTDLIEDFERLHPGYMKLVEFRLDPSQLLSAHELLAVIIRDHEQGNEIATAFLDEAMARKLLDPFDSLTIAEIDELDRKERGE